MSRIFVSHTTSDRAFVETELLGTLKALGFDVWFAERDVVTAEQWERSILTGLERSEWFLAVLSSRASKSEWVKDEIAWAVEHRTDRIVPVVIDECDLRGFHVRLARIQNVDYRGSRDVAREKLIECLVNGEYNTRSLAHNIKGLMECPSKEILIVWKVETRGVEQRATIVGANAKANEFFGRRSGLTIAGADAQHAFEVLSRWIEPAAFKAFVAEQKYIAESFNRGEELHATVPMKMEGNHPIERFRGQSFLPVTIAYSRPDELRGNRVEYFVVLYLHLGALPKLPAND